MTSDQRPRPRAFRLDEVRPEDPRVAIEPQPDAFEREGVIEPEEAAIEAAQKRGIMARRGLSWGGVFWSALGALLSLAIAVWMQGLIESFFARSAALGWIGVALLALVGVALLALLGRELAGLMRQRQIARLHMAFAQARAADDRDAARALVGDLASLYQARPATARARANLAELTREIVDGRDLIDIAERELMPALDAEATREIASAAKRVSVVTAISPRALVDVIFAGGAGFAAHPPPVRNLWGTPGPDRIPAAGAVGGGASGHHRRHGGGGQSGAAGAGPWSGRATVGAAWGGCAQRHAHRPRRPLSHGRLPPHALRCEESAGGQRRRAVSVRRGEGRGLNCPHHPRRFRPEACAQVRQHGDGEPRA